MYMYFTYRYLPTLGTYIRYLCEIVISSQVLSNPKATPQYSTASMEFETGKKKEKKENRKGEVRYM